MTTSTSESEARAATAAIATVAAAGRLLALCEQLSAAAAELTQAEAQHRAALSEIGIYHCRRAPARELAADVVLHALEPLCPFVRRVTAASAREAALDLLTLPCARRLEDAADQTEEALTR